ncbi:thioesterase [Alphaproteobacteria bacterium 46_93_T64]|nr:thioesterase [Alphaproteobacteria bacterium 46_93_T64]
MQIPNGFKPHFRKSDFTAPWEPIYSNILPDRVQLGLTIAPPHTNSRGFVHGGLIAALSDNTMGITCGVALGDGARLVTASLVTDFISSGEIGEWLLFDAEVLKAGGRLCFAQCIVKANDRLIARASATFSVVRKKTAN